MTLRVKKRRCRKCGWQKGRGGKRKWSESIFGPSEATKKQKRDRDEQFERVDAIDNRLRTVVYPEYKEAKSDVDAYNAMDIEEKKNTDESQTLANVSGRVIRQVNQVKAKRRLQTVEDEKKTLQKAKDKILSNLAGQTGTNDKPDGKFIGKEIDTSRPGSNDIVTAGFLGIPKEEIERRRMEMIRNDERLEFAQLVD